MDTLKSLKLLSPIAAMALSTTVNAVTLVQTSDPGFYNNSLGTILNNTNGGDTSTGYFPTTNDSNVSFPTAPDLSVASSILGNWLTDPLHLNSNWSYYASIPNQWAVGTEVAVMYQFDTLGATNVVANFGVDNGIYAWLDGVYIGGGRNAGGVVLGEYSFNIGNLDSGTHFLQLLLEDHGVTNGYAAQITADTYIPGPPPVPIPAAIWLFGSGLVGLIGFARRNRA